jgi:hypothetical protein
MLSRTHLKKAPFLDSASDEFINSLTRGDSQLYREGVETKIDQVKKIRPRFLKP